MWYVYIFKEYIYIQSQKENEILSSATAWMDWEGMDWDGLLRFYSYMLAWGLVSTEDNQIILYTVHLKEIPLIH